MSLKTRAGALWLGLALLAACGEPDTQGPGQPETAPVDVIAVLRQADYHGPAGISRWVAQDRSGTRTGATLLVPPEGSRRLQQAFAAHPALASRLSGALATGEVTNPDSIDLAKNTLRANLGALVGPSILNVTPALQSKVTFYNSFYS